MIFLFASSHSLLGQEDIAQIVSDSIQIIDFVHKAQNIKTYKANNSGYSLLNSVENQSFATIRTGGPAVLSTMLHRGMASRHLAVIWGGFNIQSVVNGTFDLGLIRNTFDEVKFYNHGTSPSTGNASMAGALSLENDCNQANSTKIKLSGSSTKNISATFLNKLRYKNYYHHLALNRTAERNEYSYKNGGVKLVQKSAKFSIWSLNYEGHFILSDKVSLTGGIWLQNSNRNIPPTKTSTSIIQEQKDVNYRGFVHGTYYPSNALKIILKSAYFDELLEYQAPGIFSIAQAKIFNGSIDFIHSSGIAISTQYRNDRVEASFFNPIHTRKNIATTINHKTAIFNKFRIGFSVRPEWVDNSIQPLGVGLSLENDLSEKFTSSLRYNKGYTLPSFNDLYWPSGGNPDLKTERSHEFEFGLKFNYGTGTEFTKSLNLNLYVNLIDDWIQWTPIGGFFQPVNQRKVRNLGFEFKVEESFQITNSGRLNMIMMYSYTDSRLAKHYLNPENEGKRSIFVPLHKLNGQISWLQKTWQFHLKPLYYSKRYATVDNSTFVSGYFIVDLQAVKSFKIKEHEIDISLALDNGFNNDYENIKFFPMPLRVFRLGININI